MKRLFPSVVLPILFLFCAAPQASHAVVSSTKAANNQTLVIAVLRNGGGFSRSVTPSRVPAKTVANARKAATVVWNGYGFKFYSGRDGQEFFAASDDLAFQGKQWATFTVVVRVSVVGPRPSSDSWTRTVTVRRGVVRRL